MDLFPPTFVFPDWAAVGAERFPWFNSTPLSLDALRGRVVCLDFWDYTCVNCIRTLPYLAAWQARYAALGLTIVGVHAPEFAFAHATTNVERGIREFGLTYPIVCDNDYAIWQLYENQYWPAKYLIDAKGFLRYSHFGEGHYGATEAAIQALLRERDPTVVLPPLLEPLRATDREGAVCYRVTPELHCGHRRGRLGNAEGFVPDGVQRFVWPTTCPAEQLLIGGEWRCGSESLIYHGPATGVGRLGVEYQAQGVNLVLHPPPQGSATVEIRQDGQPLPPAHAGADVRYTGTTAHVVVEQPRMYALVDNPQYGRHQLELVVTTPGLAAYAFTFVSAPCA